jgi:hypothetical protein
MGKPCQEEFVISGRKVYNSLVIGNNDRIAFLVRSIYFSHLFSIILTQ